MTNREVEEIKKMQDDLSKEMKNREYVPRCPGTGKSFKVRRGHIEFFRDKEEPENIN